MKPLKPKFDIKFIDNYGHFYLPEGEKEPYVSVTAINKFACTPDKLEALMGWATKVFGEYVDKELTDYFSELKQTLEKNKDKTIKVDNKLIHNLTNTFDIEKLIKEGKKERKKFLENAGDIGTRLHAAVDEFFNTGNIPILDDDTQVPFQNFLKWFNTNHYKVIMTDSVLASKTYKYGGRMDSLLEDKEGNLIITDFKTSNSIQSIEYKLQLAAYRQALKETYGIENINKGLLIRFDKEKKTFETLEVYNLDEYFEGFLCALKMKELNDLDKKNKRF